MPVVGDIAQATGSWAHDGWDSVLDGLPDRRPARRVELTLGYRIPAPAMALANRVLPYAAPGAVPPSTVRTTGDEPRTVACGAAAADGEPAMGGPSTGEWAPLGATGPSRSRRAGSARPPNGEWTPLGATLAEVIAEEQAEVGEGNVAVIVPDSLHEALRGELRDRSVVFGGPGRSGLEHQVTLVPVRLVKGLEVDAAVVVEPARIMAEECQGIRSLYVALTRATRRVTVVHAEPLPEVLLQPCAPARAHRSASG